MKVRNDVILKNSYLSKWFLLAMMEVNLNSLKQDIQEFFLANANYSPRQQSNTSIE
jgi:hypothetical protein